MSTQAEEELDEVLKAAEAWILAILEKQGIQLPGPQSPHPRYPLEIARLRLIAAIVKLSRDT
jgi:hypothetical protein